MIDQGVEPRNDLPLGSSAGPISRPILRILGIPVIQAFPRIAVTEECQTRELMNSGVLYYKSGLGYHTGLP